MADRMSIPPSYHFRVDFIEEIGGDTAINYGKTEAVDIRFQEVSGLGYGFGTEKFREGGDNDNPHTLFKDVKYNNLILKRGLVVADSAVSKWFDDTIETLRCSPRQIMVTLLAHDQQPSVAWRVLEACPLKWKLKALNAEENALAIETLEFVYRRFQRMVI